MTTGIKNKRFALVAALLTSVPAMATPINYMFTTGTFGTGSGSSPNAVSLISADAYVSGSFTYDPDRVQLAVAPATATTAEGAVYQAVDNMTGSLHMGGSDYAFTSAHGISVVFNDGYFPTANTPAYDLLLLRGASGPVPMSGFSLGNLPLLNVELLWAEQGFGNAPGDFLSGSALPNPLPNFSGILALRLGTANSSGVASDSAYFNFNVTPVPVPGAALLFISGLFGLVGQAFFRKRATPIA